MTLPDYDPNDVPVRMAATVLIVDERPDLQVLMIERNARSVFAGSMWVYPGGAVDLADASAEADAAVAGITDAEASAQLGVAHGGIAHWVAALRETFEETGVLLTQGSEGPDMADPVVAGRFAAHRDAVNNGTLNFIDMVRSEGIVLDGSTVHPVARWVTPVGPPRRFDAWFFVAAMPPGQKPQHDDNEAVAHQWVVPSTALASAAASEMAMMTPTISVLERLATFTTAQQAIGAARAANSADDEVIRIRVADDGTHAIAWPGDDDYDAADDRLEDGVVRWPAPKAN
jgi:8-oxo-dGTP pyrophosphatase MutT (NUDIX family)